MTLIFSSNVLAASGSGGIYSLDLVTTWGAGDQNTHAVGGPYALNIVIEGSEVPPVIGVNIVSDMVVELGVFFGNLVSSCEDQNAFLLGQLMLKLFGFMILIIIIAIILKFMGGD